MARHTKIRNVSFVPNEIEYEPKNLSSDKIIKITLEELEAIRLSDILELNQIEAAKKINVSRATYQRILLSARKKLALSIIECQKLVISGGTYNITCCRYVDKNNKNIDIKKEKDCKNEKCNSKKLFCINNCYNCRGGENGTK